MRELTLVDTGYLSAGLVLCLVLPLLMSFRRPQDVAVWKSCMKIVWAGQMLLALAGVFLLASARFAPYAAAFGLVSYVASMSLVLRKARAVEKCAA